MNDIRPTIQKSTGGVTKFLNPKNDFAFKKIFGTERNKDILIHFLNDMLMFKNNGHIVDISFLKTIQDPETASKKTSIVDILCTDQSKNTYIVEMQVVKEKGFEKRAQYYASKAYISQANIGEEYYNLKEIIFLAISDFIMFPNKKDYKSDHVILDMKNHDHDLKDFSFTFLELPKFNKDINQLSTMIDKWAYFFKHAEKTSEENLQKLVGNDQIIERAFKELNRFSWNDAELLTYDQEAKYEGVRRAQIDYAKDEGRIEGRIEERAEIAKNLINEGVPLQLVEKVSKLSATDVQKFALEIIQNSKSPNSE
ncbi:MAG: Rpn family recombination-promoting nuclease/putative transposase [Candidatus Protochlamydia sp.]|nr:Rpn family recombination-promoting nuclease/putative transposase [Candidatus Protochlamydia sp.]